MDNQKFRVGLIGVGWVGEKRVRTIRDLRGGCPNETIWEYDDGDPSWAKEWIEFLKALCEGREPTVNGEEGLCVMEIVQALSRSHHAQKIIPVPSASADSKLKGADLTGFCAERSGEPYRLKTCHSTSQIGLSLRGVVSAMRCTSSHRRDHSQ